MGKWEEKGFRQYPVLVVVVKSKDNISKCLASRFYKLVDLF